MKLEAIFDRPDVDTLTAVIARSPIVVAEPTRQSCHLPAGFDEVDAAILHWLAAEGRRIGRGYLTI